MIVLDTICHETIWGGSRLKKYTTVECNKIGHLYSVYCREEMSNKVLNGIWKGKDFNDVFPQIKDGMNMSNYEFFPLTIALTEANDNLSIQVHPDDYVAQNVEKAPRGKRESWLFLECPEEGFIINGCVCKNEEEKEKLLAEKKYYEMTDKLYVEEGDYVFVEPGTLHAITAGSLVYEIEEGADYTYRFYDYNRVDSEGNMRELHIDKATKALHIECKSATKRYQGTEEIVEKTYATKKIDNVESYTNCTESIECFTLIRGKTKCDEVSVLPGMTVILYPGESIQGGNIEMAIVARFLEVK